MSEPLSVDEERFWRALARTLVALPRALDADLARGAGLHLSEYSVLMHLSETPDRTLRMSDLAGKLALSPSRVTRLVDSLGREGLVQRRACPTDSRGNLAVLTDAGLERLRGAWPVHLASVRQRVVDQVRPVDLPAFTEALENTADA